MIGCLKRLRDSVRGGVAAAIVALALVTYGAPAAQAQDASEDEVRAMLGGLYLGAFLGTASAGFELGAQLRLNRAGGPDSDRFDVTLPGIRFTGAEGTGAELGDITLQITVLGEGRFKISGDLPKEIVFRGSSGVSGRLQVERHKFDGIWNENFFQFETLDWRSDSWRAVDATGAEVFTIMSGGLILKLEQTSSTHGDTVIEFELNDIFVSAPFLGVLQIDRITASGEARNSDLEGYGRLLGDFAASPPGDLSDPDTLSALDDLILSNLGVLGDLNYLVGAEGLSGRFGGFGTNVRRFSVDSIEFGFGLEGLGDPTGTIRLRYGHRGIDVPNNGLPPGVLPHSVGLSLSFQGLPMREIFQGAVEYGNLTQDGEPDPAADAALGEALVGLFMEAQSLLAIDELSLESDILALDGRGTVRPDPAGRGPVTGKGRITIRGLERLQRELLSEISTETLSYIAILGILMALGEEVEDERGRAFVYNLEVGPEGQLLINGQDFAPLFDELNSP
ncbi:MAG: hypothetical protein IID55_10315 [Proteobacteria bacterium]|nr:hypothetical protein [Pseudomonadota bacterium]